MKQKISLGGSITILIGVVIGILALVRGPLQTGLLLGVFALWGLWVLLTLLRPAWRANKAYRYQEKRAAMEQNEFSGRNLAELLLRHVNCRISEALQSVYPNARVRVRHGPTPSSRTSASSASVCISPTRRCANAS